MIILFAFAHHIQVQGAGPLNIVMLTDDNYVPHVAVVIQSVKENTPTGKRFIIFSPKRMGKDNRKKLLSMGDDLTEVYIFTLPRAIVRKIKKYKSRDWSELIMTKLFFTELWRNPPKGQEILQEVKDFLYIDSDTIAIRNISEIFTLKDNAVISGADATFISSESLEELEEDGGIRSFLINGGVLLFNMQQLLVDFAEENKFLPILLEERECCDYCLHPKTVDIIKRLRKMKQQKKNIYLFIQMKDMTLEEIKHFLGRTLRQRLEPDIKFILRSTSTLMKIYRRYFGNEFIRYCEEMLENMEDIRIPPCPGCAFVTDEDILQKYLRSNYLGNVRWQLSLRYNFVVSLITPETETAYEQARKISPRDDVFTRIHSKMMQYPKVKAKLQEEKDNAVILHFDSCVKPWTVRGEQYARKYMKNPKKYEKYFPYWLYYYYRNKTPFRECHFFPLGTGEESLQKMEAIKATAVY